MSFMGSAIATVLPVALVAGAMIVLFYLLKQKKRKLMTSCAFLWSKVLVEPKATRWFRNLRQLISLFIQLSLLALLVLALLDPRENTQAARRQSIAILLDASASMLTQTTGDRLRWQQALNEAKIQIENMGFNDEAVILQVDHRAQVLAPLSSNKAELWHALEKYQPAHGVADIQAGIQLAQAVLSHVTTEKRIVLIGDQFEKLSLEGAKGPSPTPAIEFISVTASPTAEQGNLAIIALNARRYRADPTSVEVYLGFKNYFSTTVSATLELYGDEQLIDTIEVDLQPGERKLKIYPNYGSQHSTLRAQLVVSNKIDVNAVDDVAWCVVPELEPVNLLVVTPGNPYLKAAFLLNEQVAVEFVHPEQYAAELSQNNQLTIFDRMVPKKPHVGHAIYIAPPPKQSPVKAKFGKHMLINKVRSKHEMLRWTSLQDVTASKYVHFFPGKRDKTILAVGGQKIIVTHQTKSQKAVLLGIDLMRSDLPLRADFLFLLLNMIESFETTHVDLNLTYRVGHTERVPVPWKSGEAQLLAPHAQVVKIFKGQTAIAARHVGIYQLKKGDETWPVAINLFDEQESDVFAMLTGAKKQLEQRTKSEALELVAPKAAFKEGTIERGASAPVAPILWWRWCLIILLGVLVGEWWLWHRKITV